MPMPAHPNGHVARNGLMSDYWRGGGTSPACYAHRYTTDYYYTRIGCDVFKDLEL